MSVSQAYVILGGIDLHLGSKNSYVVDINKDDDVPHLKNMDISLETSFLYKNFSGLHCKCSYHWYPACFKLQMALSRWQTLDSWPWILKPLGCSI